MQSQMFNLDEAELEMAEERIRKRTEQRRLRWLLEGVCALAFLLAILVAYAN